MEKKDTLILKYRPEVFDDYLGNDAVVASVIEALEKNTSHSFIFTGTAGGGKTTLARIIANELGCDPHNIVEIDAATHSGAEAMRDIADKAKMQTIGKSPVRVVIIDEAHGLSKQAWDSLLKAVEEPPAYLYWIFCTTNPAKIPKTITSRCMQYNLKPVPNDAVFDLLCRVTDEEGFDTSDEILDLIIKSSNGSVRAALVSLAMVQGITDRRAAAELLSQPLEDAEVIEFCRFLASPQGRTWPKAVEYLQQFNKNQVQPETIRMILINYVTAIVLNTKAGKSPSVDHLHILDVFSEEYNSSEKYAPLILCVNEIING